MCHSSKIHGRFLNIVNWLVNSVTPGLNCTVITNSQVTFVLPEWEPKGYWQSTDNIGPNAEGSGGLYALKLLFRVGYGLPTLLSSTGGRRGGWNYKPENH